MTHQPADLFLSVGGRARRGLDHGGGLVVRQLLDAALAGHDVTDLRSVRTHLAGYTGITQTGRAKPGGLREGGKDKKSSVSPPGEGRCASVLGPLAGRAGADT